MNFVRTLLHCGHTLFIKLQQYAVTFEGYLKCNNLKYILSCMLRLEMCHLLSTEFCLTLYTSCNRLQGLDPCEDRRRLHIDLHAEAQHTSCNRTHLYRHWCWTVLVYIFRYLSVLHIVFKSYVLHIDNQNSFVTNHLEDHFFSSRNI
jgi:hypothetical protein